MKCPVRINHKDPAIDIIKLENLIFVGTPMLLLLFFTSQKRNHILMSKRFFFFFGCILMIPSLLFSKNDLFSLIYTLCAQVFLIAKDFGARPAYIFANFHPERVLGVVTMGVPYLPPGPATFDKHLPEGFYISRWRV
jgi:hypothetical protein